MDIFAINKDIFCLIFCKLENWELWSFLVTCKSFYLWYKQTDFWKNLSLLKYGKCYDRKTYFKTGLQVKLGKYSNLGKNLDFDVILYGIFQFYSLPDIKIDIEKLVYYIDRQKLYYIYFNTTSYILAQYPNTSTIIMQQINKKWYSQTSLAKTLIYAYSSDNEVWKHLIHRFGFRFYNSVALCLTRQMNSKSIHLLRLVVNGIMVDHLYKNYYSQLDREIIVLLWQYQKEQVVKFINLVFTWRVRTIMRVYRKLGIDNEVRFMFFKHLICLPPAKYLSQEKQIINYCEQIIDEIHH